MQPPVRLYGAGLFIASVMVFAGTVGWHNGVRSQSAAVEPHAPALAPAPVQSRPVASAQEPKPKQTATPKPAATPVKQEPRKHVVAKGETLWGLARRYSLELQDLMELNGNIDPGHLQIGQVLTLPAKAAAAADDARPVSASEVDLIGAFIWPVDAPISSTFGPRDGRNHAGLDLAANMGDDILAARDGSVYYAGEISGYGNTVILQHEDGTRTLYAHASRLLVKSGQQVRQGDKIALVGSTGHSTGPHLHFEIIVNDQARDPELYLPHR